MQVTKKRTRELFQVAGDAPEPGGSSRGVVGSYDLTAGAEAKPVVYYSGRFGEFFLTFDVYRAKGEPLEVYLLCPVCALNKRKHQLRIRSNNKAIDFDPVRLPRFKDITHEQLISELGLHGIDDLRGTLSIEPFACTFEEKPELRRGFGLSRCGFQIRVSDNIARDA